MLLGAIVFATLFGFVLGFCLCLWWHLDEDKERSCPGVSTLPNDFVDFVPETSDWFQLLEQFFFQRTRNKDAVNEYACQQLRKEVSAVLSKINGIKRFEIRDFSLGESAPLLDSFQVVKVQKSADADGDIEEVALQTNFSYFNGISFVLSVSHVLGVADLSVALLQLSGPAVFGFVTSPCEHWYFSFKEEPTVDLKVKVRGQLLPFKRKIELLVSNGIRKGIRKMHVLPAIKPRFKPFFSSDVTLDQIAKIRDEHFQPNFSVDFSKHETNGTDFDSFQSTSLGVTIARLSNLSLNFGPVRVGEVFATLSVDYKSLVPSIIVSSPDEQTIRSAGRKSISEFLSLSCDRSTFNEIFTFAESKEIENGIICYRLKVASVSPNRVHLDLTSENEFAGNGNETKDVNAESDLREGDIILSIDGVDIVSKHFGDVYHLMQAHINAIDNLLKSTKTVLKIFAVRKYFSVQRREVTVSGVNSSPRTCSRSARRVDTRKSEPTPEIKIAELDTSKSTVLETDHYEEKVTVLSDVIPTQVLNLRRHSADAASTFSGNNMCELAENQTLITVLSASSIDVSKPVTEPKCNDGNTAEISAEPKTTKQEARETLDAKPYLEVQDGPSSVASGLTAETTPQLRNQTSVESAADPDAAAFVESELPSRQSFNQHSESFPAAHIINCCNSFTRNTFSFDVQPKKTEFLNVTVWGVDTYTKCHYPLANLSLPVGHILKMCSITSSFSATKTFYLSQSVLAFAAPANTSPLQLESMSPASKEKVLARCYGSIMCQFKVHTTASSPECIVPRRASPEHQNEKPPSSSISSNRSQVNLTTATPSRQGKRYFAHLRGAASKSSECNHSAGAATKSVAIGIADKLKPRIQHDSKFVATAVKSSFHATLPILQNHSNVQQTDAQYAVLGSETMRESRSFNENESFASLVNESNKNGVGCKNSNGGAKLAGKIVQMKGSVKKISSDFLKEQSFMDRAKLSQQKMASKAKPFRQLFNRNKGPTISQQRPLGKRSSINNVQLVVTNPEEELLSSVKNSEPQSALGEVPETFVESSILEFVECEEELEVEMEEIPEVDPSLNFCNLETQENLELSSVQNSGMTDDDELTAEALSNFILEDSTELDGRDDDDENEFIEGNIDAADGYFLDEMDDVDHGDLNIEDAPNLETVLENASQTISPATPNEELSASAEIYPRIETIIDDERF